MKIKNQKIILGSSSPRRSEILSNMGIKFEVIKSDTSEKYPQHLKDKEISEYLSMKKSNAIKSRLKNSDLLITADTIVVYSNKILHKPKNSEEAKVLLKMISGKKHEVITSVCLTTNQKQSVFSERTVVYFNILSDEMIDYYISLNKSFDKAGAYGIQDWIGIVGIDKIEGSYTNVVGLPSSKLFLNLLNF